MTQLSPTQKQQGVLAYSSGNHAHAIALCGKLLGIPTTIIMPSDSPPVKQAATKGYGAEIILYDCGHWFRWIRKAECFHKYGLEGITN